MRQDFNRIKIRLMIIIIAIGLIITGILGVFGFKVFENTLIDEIGHNRSDVLSQIGNQTRRIKNNLYTVSYLYYYDVTFNRYLQRLDEEDSEVLRRTVNGYLDGMTVQYQKAFGEDEMSFDVILFLRNGYRYASFEAPEGYDYMNPEVKTWYRDLLEAKGGILEIPYYKDAIRGKGYYGTGRCVMDGSGNVLGYLMVMTDEENIYNMYSELISGDREIYVADGSGNVVSSSNREVNGFQYFNMGNLSEIFGRDEYTITRMHDKEILFTRSYDENSGLYVMEEIGIEEVLGPINEVRKLLVFLALLCIVISSLYALYFAKKVTRPISELCDFMIGIDGSNIDRKCTVQGYTEINTLRERLNQMLAQMSRLMDNIKQKEKQKRELELGFLQAQINPHFMYNTLFSVKCMVDMHKNEEASSMLVSFIALLRNTLSDPEVFQTVEEEFELLEKYAELQQLRYSERIDICCECDPAVKDKKMPKLLIQPLVENAIFHGVELKKQGMVVVTAREEGGNVVITVEDNGVGIDKETLEKINRGEKLNDKDHIGLENVRERIQLNFGEKYGMKVESQEWKGTKITLYFPEIE